MRRYSSLIASIILFGGALAFAEGINFGLIRQLQPQFEVQSVFDPEMINRLSHDLDLTRAQIDQIHQITASERERVQPLLVQLRDQEYEFNKVSAKGGFDEQTVTTLASREGETHAALIVEGERFKSMINGVLNPEQSEKFKRLSYRLRDWPNVNRTAIVPVSN